VDAYTFMMNPVMQRASLFGMRLRHGSNRCECGGGLPLMPAREEENDPERLRYSPPTWNHTPYPNLRDAPWLWDAATRPEFVGDVNV